MVHAPKVGTLCNGEFSVKRLTLLAEYGDRSNVFLRSGNVAPVTVNLGGTPAWRDNNPGNLRAAPDAIGTNIIYSKGNPNGKPMAIFPDVQVGFDAQQRQLFDPNFSSTIGYPNLSIAAAVAKYAPPEDNNPTAVMIQELSTAAGVLSTTIMGTLTPAQQAAFMAEEQRIETSTPGTVESFNWGPPNIKY
jgi:hypothetical protein